MSELHFQPVKGRAQEILKAILQTPEVTSCGRKDAMLLRLACEEIVMNVTSYAYPEETDGFLDITIQKADRISIRFEDGGVPFNPLEQSEPDITLSAENREVGGLGIFLCKKLMDSINYRYENGNNVLTMTKLIWK